MREIRLLRSRWRGLETESRSGLHGHERGNPGYRQDPTLRTTAPALDPTKDGIAAMDFFVVPTVGLRLLYVCLLKLDLLRMRRL